MGRLSALASESPAVYYYLFWTPGEFAPSTYGHLVVEQGGAALTHICRVVPEDTAVAFEVAEGLEVSQNIDPKISIAVDDDPPADSAETC